MERHRAGREEELVELRMDVDGAPPAESRRCSRCRVAFVAAMAAIVVALVLGFISCYFTLSQSCKQDAAPARTTERISLTAKLRESGEKGRYDVFTANKAATYLIYGWVNLKPLSSGEVILRNTFMENSITLEQKRAEREVFFFQKVKLVDNSRISIYVNASCSDNLFHVLEV